MLTYYGKQIFAVTVVRAFLYFVLLIHNLVEILIQPLTSVKFLSAFGLSAYAYSIPDIGKCIDGES